MILTCPLEGFKLPVFLFWLPQFPVLCYLKNYFLKVHPVSSFANGKNDLAVWSVSFRGFQRTRLLLRLSASLRWGSTCRTYFGWVLWL